MKNNISRGAFVSGNHDVYDADMPIEDIKQMFAHEFPLNSDVTYFDSEVGVVSKDIGDNVLLVADVMYTDYKLMVRHRNPAGDVHKNIVLADSWRNGRYGMNDFNYGKCKKTWPGINDKDSRRENRLVPEYYLEHHERAFKQMTDIVERNQDKDIIVMTHHCLSPKCIDSEHEDSSVVASYVSDKEDWIAAHPNIKCICSGHIHTRKSFKVGSALYVMNSLGYCDDHFKQWSDSTRSYEPWTPDCMIDTDSWTIEFKPHAMPEWNSKYEQNIENMKELLPFFVF